jgi:hypothetical protein
MSPASGLKSKSVLLAACFMLVFCLAYSSTLKMEATCSAETSVHFQLTTRRYIEEDKKFQHQNYTRFSCFSYLNYVQSFLESVIWLPHAHQAPSCVRICIILPYNFSQLQCFCLCSVFDWPRKRSVWGDGCVALLPPSRPTGCVPK